MKSEVKKQAKRREETKKHEAGMQEEKVRAVRSIKEEPCLYCGKPTLCRDYIINPGAKHELPSCSKECFDKTRKFVDYDKHYRMPYYMVLLVFVVANLFLFGSNTATRWKYLPMLGIGIATCVSPLVFTLYERYQKLGIYKTRIIIRVVAAAIIVFALILIISC